MAKVRHNGNQQYFQDPMGLERSLIVRISETGREQMKKRRKAGLSSFYAKDGRIIEVLPDNSENVRHAINSKWIVLEKEKRSIKLK